MKQMLWIPKNHWFTGRLFDRWCWLTGHTTDLESNSFKTLSDSEWCQNGIRRYVGVVLSVRRSGRMDATVCLHYVRKGSCQLIAEKWERSQSGSCKLRWHVVDSWLFTGQFVMECWFRTGNRLPIARLEGTRIGTCQFHILDKLTKGN